jgi:hypothetical protein
MILTIALALLQILAIPQKSIPTLFASTAEAAEATAPSAGTAETAGAAAPDTSTADAAGAAAPTTGVPLDDAVYSALASKASPTSAGLSTGLSAPNALVTPLSPAPLRDRPQKLQRREWLALSTAQHGAATFDAWSTRRVISSGEGRELNPMLRPFAGNGSLYAVVQVSPLLFDYVGRRMMTSQHNWIRRAWWVPQAVNTIVLLASGAHNLSVR